VSAQCVQAANLVVPMLANCRQRLIDAGWDVPSTIPPDP
jgi:hypothetical protein